MELYNLGFIEAGKWKLKETLKSGISFQIYKFINERVVYAFVVDDAVKYIGICDNTNTTLKDRMSRYQGMAGSGTNKRIAINIKECLEKGKRVAIIVLNPEMQLHYKTLKIDLVKGLENPLIERLRPEWNIQK